MADDTNLEKIKLLDQIFQVLSLDDMKQIASCDLVVSKLRGDNVARGPCWKCIKIVQGLISKL